MNAFLDAWQRKQINAPSGGVREKLEAYHLAALQETVSHARARSRFYSTHLKDAPPFNSLNEFTALPFTLPAHIRENSLAFLCVSLDEITRIVTLETSGTTARPKRIFFTRRDLEATIEFFSRVLSQLTHPAEKALILLPANTPSGAGDLLNTAMARIGGQGLVPGPATDFNHTLDILFTHTPSVIIGMPVQVLALGESAKAKNKPAGFLRHAVLTADYVSPALTSRISDTLGCRVWNHYGMTETGFGGGIDCPAHGGYHLREGDMSRFLHDPCPCNSSFKRLAPVRHRYSGLISLSDGSVLGMPDLDDVFFRIPGVVDFHAALSRDPKTPRLDITLKALDPSQLQNVDIQKHLPHSPVLQKAIDTGVLRLGPLGTEAFEFVDTYRSKRKIQLEKR